MPKNNKKTIGNGKHFLCGGCFQSFLNGAHTCVIDVRGFLFQATQLLKGIDAANHRFFGENLHKNSAVLLKDTLHFRLFRRTHRQS